MPWSHILPAAIASSVSVYILSSVLFLGICGVCCYYNLKQKQIIWELNRRIDNYDQVSHSRGSVTPSSGITGDAALPSYQNQDLEMIENVAYDTHRFRAP